MADILLGVVGVYIALSLVATTINEWVMRQFYSRGDNLHKAISGMLSDDDSDSALTQHFFTHPFFTKLHESSSRLPSYLNSHDFSKILVDILANYTDGNAHDLVQIKQGIESLSTGPTRNLLLSYLANSNDLTHFDHQIQKWFHSTMERASGWYKRKAHISLFQVGFILAVLLNVDSFALFQHLQKDTQSLEALTQIAQNMHADSLGTSDWSPVLQIIEKPTFFGMGWNAPSELYLPSQFLWAISQTPKHILGWIITAIAISFGAPFWFDLLAKFTRGKTATPAIPSKGEKT